jgi:hypothetical protein
LSAFSGEPILKRPWFSDAGIGNLFLMPITLYGWLAVVALMVILAISATVHQDWVWAFRVFVTFAFLSLSYYKSDKWGSR